MVSNYIGTILLLRTGVLKQNCSSAEADADAEKYVKLLCAIVMISEMQGLGRGSDEVDNCSQIH